MADIKERIHGLDTEVVIEKVIESTVESIRTEVAEFRKPTQ